MRETIPSAFLDKRHYATRGNARTIYIPDQFAEMIPLAVIEDDDSFLQLGFLLHPLQDRSNDNSEN